MRTVSLYLMAVVCAASALHAAEPVPYVESTRCGNCHRPIFAQWRASQMANSARDPIYQDMYKLALAEDPDWAIACARCHEPRAVLDGQLVQTPLSQNEGVACDYCHRIANVWEAEDGTIVHSPLDVGADKQATKYGPLRDARSPFHNTEYAPAYESATYCGMCHQYTAPNGIATEQQYRQWKETGLAEAEVYCQTCHMPPRPGKASYVPPSAPYRQEVHEHRFGGGDSPTRLLGSFLIAFNQPDQNAVDVTIFNAVAGHNVPGHAHGLRRLHLEIEAKDRRGRVLSRDRETYSRLFATRSGEETVYFWRASRVLSDNTIPSGESRTVRMTLPRGTERVVARVLYQRYPDELVERFGWRNIFTTPRPIATDSVDVR